MSADPQTRLGEGPGGKLGHPADADDHRAGRPDPPNNLVVMLGNGGRCRQGAVAGRIAGGGHVVFDRYRYAGQREGSAVRIRVDAGRFGPYPSWIDGLESTQPRIERCDSLQVGLGHGERGGLARTHHLGQLSGRGSSKSDG